MTFHLFKGLYQEFLEVQPNVLTDTSHPFHPDLIIIPEPRLSVYFDTWIPALWEILKNNVPCIITGYSATTMLSHDAANLAPTLDAMRANMLLPLQRNPYSLKILPETSLPHMPIFQGYSKPPIQYSNSSAKHAVVCAICGLREDADLQNIDLRNKSTVAELKRILKEKDVEVEQVDYSCT